MYRTSVLAVTFALFAGTTSFAQFPAQPPPPKSPMSQGTEKERAACHPDVVRYCQTELKTNENDVLGILACLQRNRAKISRACQEVLESHGQ